MANSTRAPSLDSSAGSRYYHIGSRYTVPVVVLIVCWKYVVLPSPSSWGPSTAEARGESAAAVLLQPEFRRIDTHAHFVPPFYYDRLKSNGLKAGGRTVPKWNALEHLELMDKLQIETAVLSVSTPGARLPGDNAEETRKLARELNEYGHMLVARYPSRFQFFATLTLPDVEGSIEEAIYSLDTLKAAGVVLLANSEGHYLGCEQFDPLMKVLNDRETTIFIHPSSIPGLTVSGSGGNAGIPSWVVDFLLDTTRAAANLVMNNVTGRYPNLRWILAHSGGFMPFSAYRMGGALHILTNLSRVKLIRELRTFYADTALSSSPSALPSTIAFLTHSHITFGSDYPFAPNSVIEHETAQLDMFPLDLDERLRINYRNAHRLLSKPLSYWRNVSFPSAAVQC